MAFASITDERTEAGDECVSRMCSKEKEQKAGLKNFHTRDKECKVLKFELCHEGKRVSSSREITPTIGVLSTYLPQNS